MTADTHGIDTHGNGPPPATPGEGAPILQPDDPRAFWSAAVDLDELELPERRESGLTLERLVPSPFPRSGFPLIGFLATVYDHVASFARAPEPTEPHQSEGSGEQETEPRPLGSGRETEPRP